MIKKHPIHQHLDKLPNEVVKQLFSEFKLKEIKGRSIERRRNAIAHYFFIKFSDCPLTSLKNVLNEKGITIVTEQKKGTKRKQKATLLSFGLTSDQSVNTRNSKKSKTNADTTSQGSNATPKGSIEKSAGKTQQTKRTRSISDQRDGSNATKD